MAYVALDMRNPEKCVIANYPEDAILDVHYEVLGKSRRQSINLPDVEALVKCFPRSSPRIRMQVFDLLR